MICYVAVLCDNSLNKINMIPSSWQLGRWFYCCVWTCLSINKLIVLRCKIFWSCAQQLLSEIITMVKLAPYYLASDAGLRLGIVSEVLSLLVCPLLSYLLMPASFVWLRCMISRSCAQHKLYWVVLILEISQWSANWGLYSSFPMMSLGKAYLCQAEGFNQ
jgi:hypothetical protein